MMAAGDGPCEAVLDERCHGVRDRVAFFSISHDLCDLLLSSRVAPAFANADSIFFKVCKVCARASPTPTTLPSGPVAVVPDTCT
jgi:hypothetical protein